MKKKKSKHGRKKTITAWQHIFSYVFPLSLMLAVLIAGFIYRDLRCERYPVLYAEYVMEASEEFGVEPDLIFAVIRTESESRPRVVSKSGAVGLMQIMPGITLPDINIMLGESYTEADLYNPEINIRCGVCYLSYLIRVFGNNENVYAAYNAGPTRVRQWLGDDEISEDGKLTNIPIEETANYVVKVRNARTNYIQIYDKKYK